MATTSTPAPSSTSVQFHGYTFPLETVPCDFCGGSEFFPFWQRMRHGLDLNTVFCRNCGLCMTNPRPTAEANSLFYSQLYNRFHKRDSVEPGSPYVVKSRRLALPRVETLSQFVDPDGNSQVFEIGAGVGQFQVAARERTRWRVSGLEPGNEQSALCRKLGLDVTQAFFQALPIDDASLDVVVSFHVLEHVDSPGEFIRHANRILKPGGILHLEVPNLLRPGEGGLSQFLQFPHQFNFTAAALRNLARAIGGFEPLFVAERYQALTLVARKARPALPAGQWPTEFERCDVQNVMQRLRTLERVYKLAACIPRWPVLKKIRSTLETV